MPKELTPKKNKKVPAEPFVIPPVPTKPQQCKKKKLVEFH